MKIYQNIWAKISPVQSWSWSSATRLYLEQVMYSGSQVWVKCPVAEWDLKGPNYLF